MSATALAAAAPPAPVGRRARWIAVLVCWLLIVFDGDPPEDAPDLVGSGRRTADDLIAELDGPFWLASSDRELRERVGRRAERFLGGGSFLTELRAARC